MRRKSTQTGARSAKARRVVANPREYPSPRPASSEPERTMVRENSHENVARGPVPRERGMARNRPSLYEDAGRLLK